MPNGSAIEPGQLETIATTRTHSKIPKETRTMITTRFRSAVRLSIATMAVAGLALSVVPAPPAAAAGLRNCVEITGPQSGRAGCYELVWANDSDFRMTFSNTSFQGATPHPLDAFYVVAPQSDAPQGYPPNTFAHDHVVRDVPARNHGSYTVQLQGFFVLCSGQGIVSGACVPTWTSVGGPDALPFATTVNGQPLTSAASIESSADAGLVALVNLGPGAVIVGTIGGN
jgi:hypothetical protein